MNGTRFPRSMLNGPGNERLLVSLGVEIVDELDQDLEAAAREWLAAMPVIKDQSPATQAVRAALEKRESARKGALNTDQLRDGAVQKSYRNRSDGKPLC
jgi:hypothetical protein